MVTNGDRAPDFTAPLAHGDDEIGSFTLSDHLDEAPLVLAFFPGAFTSTCSHEMNTFQARLSAFEDAGGRFTASAWIPTSRRTPSATGWDSSTGSSVTQTAT